MIYLSLFYTFFKIGLFGFGGGYGMLSLIQMETVLKHPWMSSAEFTNIVAISQMTYCSYTTAHNARYSNLMAILASATSTLALVLPSFILMIMISKMFMKYVKTPVVQHIFMGLHPAVVGLLGGATLLLCNADNFSSPAINPWYFFISLALFASTFYATMWLKINPIRMICYAAFAGLLLLY